jgi:hypothetical protein
MTLKAYTMKIADGSGTREQMEQVVSAHGNIRISDFKVGRLVVEAEPNVIDDFKAKHPDWVADPVAYLDCAPPPLNYDRLRELLDRDQPKNPNP